MSISKDTVRKAARLARIRVENSELESVTLKLNGTLKWIEQLQELNTDNVKPLASVVDITLPLRADVVQDDNIQARILANAPEKMQGFFVVPKVVEQM